MSVDEPLPTTGGTKQIIVKNVSKMVENSFLNFHGDNAKNINIWMKGLEAARVVSTSDFRPLPEGGLLWFHHVLFLLFHCRCFVVLLSIGVIGGAARTFACKSQECLWQDWYISINF